MDISRTVAVITGAASGLGEATARHLLGLGARGIVALDVDAERGAALADELGDRYLYSNVDVSDEHAVDVAVAQGAHAFNGITAVVAAAGIAAPGKLLGQRGPLPMERFDAVMKVNVYGTVHVMRAAAAQMVAGEPGPDGERGVLIAVASGAAFEGQVGQVAYSASKGALVAMTLPLARELAEHGIRVMTIAPGAFDTPIYETIPPAVKEEMVDVTLFPKRLGAGVEFAMFVEELLRNRLHNGRTYRFDGGVYLPVAPGRS
ncbi:SDR family NAD(P)-dependent oxidoreductase [Georgenia sp. H159]|uniref:SDR family NAD(P)-dependent oxidoreductase n=1 Tax=Georgenia sp. H159 TaxID=3076115 RepID=UPI002D79A7C2|nr:SDR family NAD(P)-dependent oxidoreductase [Georgenia sp. H159]